MSWMKPVFSTSVREVGYDDTMQALVVQWTNGRKSAYLGVPEAVAYDLANAPSVGSMIHTEIKPNYTHQYL